MVLFIPARNNAPGWAAGKADCGKARRDCATGYCPLVCVCHPERPVEALSREGEGSLSGASRGHVATFNI